MHKISYSGERIPSLRLCLVIWKWRCCRSCSQILFWTGCKTWRSFYSYKSSFSLKSLCRRLFKRISLKVAVGICRPYSCSLYNTENWLWNSWDIRTYFRISLEIIWRNQRKRIVKIYWYFKLPSCSLFIVLHICKNSSSRKLDRSAPLFSAITCN